MRIFSSLCALAALSFSGAAAAASPDDELLRLTPRDATLVVVVKNLRDNAAAIREGPFAQAFRESKLGREIAANPEVKHLDDVAEQLSRTLQADWREIRDKLIGDALVAAYRGGPPDAPEKESGLLLTWVRDPEFATRLIDRLTEVQKASGELKEVETRTYSGASYFRRAKAKGDDEFLFRKGSILAFSGQEEMIRQVIDLDTQAPSDQPPIVRDLDRLRARDAAISLWLNPRYFDNDLNNKAHAAAGNEAAFLSNFTAYWKAVRGVAVCLRLDRRFELSLNVAVQEEALPAAARKVGSTLNEPSALAAIFPPDALTTVTGRLDLQAFVDAISGLLAPEVWANLTGSSKQAAAAVLGGSKNLSLLASQIGPDWGFCLMPPASPKGVLPDAVAAIRVKPSADGAFEKTILDALNTVAMLVRLNYNKRSDDPVRLESRTSNGRAISFLSCEKVFPPGLRPAWSLHNGFLAIATSPEAIEHALDGQHAKPADNSNRLVAVSFREWHRYLTTRRADLIAYLPTVTDWKPAEAAAHIDEIATLFELLDRFEFVDESQSPGLIKLSLRLYPLQPLKK